ncbi:MAG: hypothetical protein WD530_03780, partial [Vicingaceae bacterium]
MVDPFSGNFSYNIPLMDVGGYPIGLSYNAGATMDQEASWVGLGWKINPGVINRNVRGVPDDFKGDEVEKTFSMKTNETYGASGMFGTELFGLDLEKLQTSLKVGVGAKYNNYSGMALDFQLHPSIGSSEGSKSPFTASLGLSLGSSGVGISPSASFSKQVREEDNTTTSMSARLGSSFNSRTGLEAITLNTSLSSTEENGGSYKDDKGEVQTYDLNTSKSMSSSRISFASPTYTPTIQNSFVNNSFSLSFSVGGELFGLNSRVQLSGYYSAQKVREPVVSSPAYGYLYHQEGVKTTN